MKTLLRNVLPRTASLLAITILSFPAVQAASPAEQLKADMEKSKITFVGHKPDGKHDGGFKEFVVTAEADMEKPSNSRLKIEITTASLWADNDKLAAHLKNPDFFDVRKYPKVVFESTRIEPQEAEGELIIHGKLTMLGETNELKAPTEVEVNESTGETKLVAKFKLNRMKWGMDYGKGKINDEVDINAELVFKR